MTAEEVLHKQQRIGLHNFYYEDEDIIIAMQEFARLKCQELLLLVAEKVKLAHKESNYYPDINKAFILGVADLDSFIV